MLHLEAPFQIKDKIWIFKLNNKIDISEKDVSFQSCQPSGNGWIGSLQSFSLANKLKNMELLLETLFINLPETDLPNHGNLPEIIKYHNKITLVDLQHVWKTLVTTDNTTEVFFNRPQQLGMCDIDKDKTRLWTTRGDHLINVTLTIKGIWCSNTKVGAIIQLDKIY